MKLYVVIMQRWGDPELHHYVEGVYDDPAKAVEAGNKEQEWRGNKYEPLIEECTINESLKAAKRAAWSRSTESDMDNQSQDEYKSSNGDSDDDGN